LLKFLFNPSQPFSGKYTFKSSQNLTGKKNGDFETLYIKIRK